MAPPGRVRVMVSPPPGVSDGVSVPPIASVKPRAMARPRPDAARARSSSRWNGANMRVPVARPARPGRGRRRAAAPMPSAPARPRDRAPRCRAVRDRTRVVDQVGDDPLEQAGVGQHQRQVVGDVDVARRRRCRCRSAPRRRPRRAATGSSCDRQRAGLQPAHRQQVVDQVGEPVGGLLDGREQLGSLRRRSRRRPAGAGWTTAALIPASGVRRSWPTAASSAERSRSISASSRPGPPRRRAARSPRPRRGRCARLVQQPAVLGERGRSRRPTSAGLGPAAAATRCPREAAPDDRGRRARRARRVDQRDRRHAEQCRGPGEDVVAAIAARSARLSLDSISASKRLRAAARRRRAPSRRSR